MVIRALRLLGLAVLVLAAILAVRGMTDRSTPLVVVGIVLLGGSWIGRRSQRETHS